MRRIAIWQQTHHQSTKGAYKFENKPQDWIDNQQLMYLADPDLTFVTADRGLIAKLSKSLDRHRVLKFTEFREDYLGNGKPNRRDRL